MSHAWVVVAVLACAAGAGADERRDEAKLHGSLARMAFSHERYAEALAEFQKAYDLAPIPDLLFNIGRCQEELGQLAPAIDSYEKYLTARPDASDRGEVQARVADLRARLQTTAPAPPPKVETASPPKEATPAPPVAAPAPPVAAPPVATTPPARHDDARRKRWIIGASIAGGVLVVGGVIALAVVLGAPSPPAAVRGNVSPGVVGISP